MYLNLLLVVILGTFFSCTSNETGTGTAETDAGGVLVSDADLDAAIAETDTRSSPDPDTATPDTVDPEGCTADNDCDDNNPCTDDLCDNGVCAHPANEAPCNDGVFCNGADTCIGGDCVGHSGNPCAGLTCDETDRLCLGCTGDSDCADGNPCTDDGSRGRLTSHAPMTTEFPLSKTPTPHPPNATSSRIHSRWTLCVPTQTDGPR